MTLLKAIYILNTIKILQRFFKDIEREILKFIRKQKDQDLIKKSDQEQ